MTKKLYASTLIMMIVSAFKIHAQHSDMQMESEWMFIFNNPQTTISGREYEDRKKLSGKPLPENVKVFKPASGRFIFYLDTHFFSKINCFRLKKRVITPIAKPKYEI